MPVSLSSRAFARLGALLLLGSLVPGVRAAEDIRATRPDPPGTTTVISLGAYLIDILSVNDADQSFDADIYVLARWHDPRLAHEGPSARRLGLDEVWFPRVSVVNARATDSTLPPEVRVDPDGTVTYRQRTRGTFTARLDLRDFPLDHQTFRFDIVAPEMTDEELRFEPFPERATARAEVLSAGSWHFGPLQGESRTFHVAPDAPGRPEYVLSIRGDRHVRYYVVQLLLPLFAVVIMAWAPFWLDPTVVPSRLGIPITTMLTLIAFRFMLGSLVPKLPYLTRLDLLLLGSTGLVAGAIVYMAISGRMVALGREEAMRRYDRMARVAFPLAFLVVLAATTLV